ncbi:unnamed protein product, partial [Rotaria sp. Silwood2]
MYDNAEPPFPLTYLNDLALAITK